MKDLFYIVEVHPQRYNLLVKDTHYCIACGSDLESFKRTIYSYTRKYKTEDRVYKALRGLSDGGRVSPATYDQRQKDYMSGKHLPYTTLVSGVVAQALKDNRQDSPFNRVKKRMTTITPIGVAASPLPPANTKRAVGKITPCKIQRTKTTVVTTTE